MQWRGRVHEQLRPEPAALGYEVVTSDVEIEHVGYQDAVLAVRKHQRKLRLLRMDYAVNPEDPSTLFHLGMACAKLGTAAEARKYLLRLAALSAARGDYLRRVYGMLAELSLGEGKFADALRMADRGLAMFPDDEQLRYVAAQVLYEIGKYDMAAGLLAAVMNGSQPPSPYECGPNHIRRKLAPRALAAVQRMQGDFAGAEATLLKVAGEFPADTQSWYNLGLVYLDTNRREGLALALDRLSACPNGVFFANLLRAVRCLRSDQLEAAGAMIDQLVSESPHTPLPRMLRVEWLSRSRAPLGSQIQALCDLLRIQPGNAEARGWLNKLEAASLPALPAVGDGCTSVVLMPGVVAAG
jgi:tetratricopeptide (TPR) repeat protein